MSILTKSAAALLLLAGSAQAATLTGTLTSAAVGVFDSGFTVDFDDTNMNGLLDKSEITSFSGITLTQSGQFYDVFFAFSDLNGTAVATPDDLALVGQPSDANALAFVFFDNVGGNFVAVDDFAFTYEISGVNQVPLPAGLPLALAGLAALGLIRRKS